MNESLEFVHTVFSELIMRRWKGDPRITRLTKELAERGRKPRGGGDQVTALWSCTGLRIPLQVPVQSCVLRGRRRQLGLAWATPLTAARAEGT